METTISFQKLTSAVSSLPLLLEKKRLIDMHTSLATAILDQIKLRKLDLFFELEEKILSKQNLDKSLKEVSKNTYKRRECVNTGAAGARTRRFLGHYLLHPQILKLLVLCAPADFETQSSPGCTCTHRSKFLTHSLVSL